VIYVLLAPVALYFLFLLVGVIGELLGV